MPLRPDLGAVRLAQAPWATDLVRSRVVLVLAAAKRIQNCHDQALHERAALHERVLVVLMRVIVVRAP